MHNEAISTASYSIGMGNIYGLNELIYIKGAIRIQEGDARIWSLMGSHLPGPDLNEMDITFTIQQRFGRKQHLGASIRHERTGFPEVDRSTASTYLQGHYIRKLGQLTFSGSLQLMTKFRGTIDWTKILQGRLMVFYNIGELFLLNLSMDTPGPNALSAAQLEAMHSPSPNWSYGIALGIPNPYLGFRLIWQIFPKWSVDLRSRRHPQLGFSHESHFIFNMP